MYQSVQLIAFISLNSIISTINYYETDIQLAKCCHEEHENVFHPIK